jgi:hypothetical protein
MIRHDSRRANDTMKPVLKAIAIIVVALVVLVVALVVLAFALNYLVRVSYSPTRSIGIVEEWLFGRPIEEALAPPAWDRARWGMSASEIQTAYPAAKPQERVTYEHGSYCDLTLAGASIAGYYFTVEFRMDNSDRLTGVHLFIDCEQDAVSGEIAYDTVKGELIQKYGRPTTEKQSERPDVTRYFKSEWQGSNALITLDYFYVPPPYFYAPPTGLCSVNLRYEKPPDTD